MGVKRKTEMLDQTADEREQILAGQLPEVYDDEPVQTTEVDMEAEIERRVREELAKKEAAKTESTKQETKKATEEPVQKPLPGQVGGKLTHMFGGTDNDFKEEVAQLVEEKHLTKVGENIKKNVEIRDGWILVDKALLGERVMYYPEDWQFYIRPATVDAIRNWSTVDEENPFALDDVFNEILKYCLSIKTSTGPQPWSAINTWDKLCFILLVREYTFKHGEQSIRYTEDCINCDAPVDFVLESQALMYDMPDEEVLRYYDRNTREWHIDPEEFDVNAAPITLYNPTVEKDQNIKAWLIERYQENRNYKPEANFMKHLIWMSPKVSKDSTIAKRQIKEMHAKYKSWDMDLFTLMEDIIKNIVVTPQPNISAICPSCGEEVTAQVRFPDGISSLFDVRSSGRRFGTK